MTRFSPEAETFGRLYEEFKVPVYGLAWRLAGNAAEAEDLFQETWVRAVESFRRKSFRAEFAKAWLFTIALNLHRDMLRKKRTRRKALGETAGAAGAEERSVEGIWGPPPAAGDEALEQREFRRTLDGALARLPEKQRRVFVLKGCEGYTHAEVGRLLRIREATVKTLFFRAVRKLRTDLHTAFPSGIRGAGPEGACTAPAGSGGPAARRRT
jgi:RNA polymerase sigma-70 factor (ECF subfamily)